MARIRKFRLCEDSSELGRMIRRTIQSCNSRDYPPKVIQLQKKRFTEKRLSEGNYPRWVAVEKGKLVGTVAAKAESEISALFVLPSYQGQGIGERLLKTAENHIFRKCPKAKLHSSLGAAGFYLLNGYRKIKVETIGAKTVRFKVVLMEKDAPKRSFS
ncbi:MAG: GNAT family N-acetyltransferase [archaeon]